jgi:hypothetical protein
MNVLLSFAYQTERKGYKEGPVCLSACLGSHDLSPEPRKETLLWCNLHVSNRPQPANIASR